MMVVMNDISYQYCRIKKRQLEKDMYKAVKEALTLFHKDGYIHGDLWETNIIVKRDGVNSKVLGNIILVDFGWAGKKNTI